jgi:regulator of PEP synthase PpsR (kinase-PPPase family)
MANRTRATVFIVSDGRGETAGQVVRAAAVQFAGRRFRTVVKSEIRTPEQVFQAVDEAAQANAVVFYTLVSKDTRAAMRRAAKDHLMRAVDVLGPAFNALHDLLRAERGSTPGLLYTLDRERLDRMDAIDYTLKHDDGQRPHELAGAEVVLVGVSRASKSSTCFFLAYEGIRAANVPLIPEVQPPDSLLRLPREKVIGLRVNVSRLMTVRESRARNLRLTHSDPYLDKRTIAREVIDAHRTIEENQWRSIDVSYMAIEEIAREVVRLRGLKGKRRW